MPSSLQLALAYRCARRPWRRVSDPAARSSGTSARCGEQATARPHLVALRDADQHAVRPFHRRRHSIECGPRHHLRVHPHAEAALAHALRDAQHRGLHVPLVPAAAHTSLIHLQHARKMLQRPGRSRGATHEIMRCPSCAALAASAVVGTALRRPSIAASAPRQRAPTPTSSARRAWCRSTPKHPSWPSSPRLPTGERLRGAAAQS